MLKSPRRFATEASPDKRKNHILCPSSRRIQVISTALAPLLGKMFTDGIASLMQPHNASLGITFYEGTQFPKEYRGDLFGAEHGSWNRSTRAGYEIVRVPLENGHASGVYEDFITGFVTPD